MEKERTINELVRRIYITFQNLPSTPFKPKTEFESASPAFVRQIEYKFVLHCTPNCFQPFEDVLVLLQQYYCNVLKCLLEG